MLTMYCVKLNSSRTTKEQKYYIQNQILGCLAMNFIDEGTTSDAVNMKSYNYTSVEAKGSSYESSYKNDFNYRSSSACIKA